MSGFYHSSAGNCVFCKEPLWRRDESGGIRYAFPPYARCVPKDGLCLRSAHPWFGLSVLFLGQNFAEAGAVAGGAVEDDADEEAADADDFGGEVVADDGVDAEREQGERA